MTFPGQASGDFVEGASALRILYVGHRNSFAAQLTTDGFTQTNPPVVTDASKRSKQLSETPKYGVLSGSVAFTRDSGFVGGPLGNAGRPLGLFINDAAGNAYENTPGPASGLAPYVSASGTVGSFLFETQNLDDGSDLVWAAGDYTFASKNGYLTNLIDDDNTFEQDTEDWKKTKLGVVKITPDSAHGELVIDLRV